MSACPADEELIQMLEGLLDQSDQDRVEAHVETCCHCHERLEALTRGRASLFGTYVASPLVPVVIRSEGSRAESRGEDGSRGESGFRSIPAEPRFAEGRNGPIVETQKDGREILRMVFPPRLITPRSVPRRLPSSILT